MIRGTTGVVALLGRPVAHSRSPALHNAWFAALGLDLVYVAHDVGPERAVAAVGALRTLGYVGANVTVPLKERVAPALDRLDADAEATGAVNTISRDGDRWIGSNTDVPGFSSALRDAGLAVAGRRAVVLGAGGAARAVGLALLRDGAGSLVIAGRRPERAVAVAERLAAASGRSVGSAALGQGAIVGAELVVVATAGRAEAVGALDPAVLGPGAAWIDLNYWDPDPPGLRRAASVGLRTETGDRLLRAQAAVSFERWTGRTPPALLSPSGS